MSIWTFSLIILAVLAVGIKTIKATIGKVAKNTISALDNGAEVLLVSSNAMKVKSVNYLLKDVDSELKQYQELKSKYPDMFS